MAFKKYTGDKMKSPMKQVHERTDWRPHPSWGRNPNRMYWRTIDPEESFYDEKLERGEKRPVGPVAKGQTWKDQYDSQWRLEKPKTVKSRIIGTPTGTKEINAYPSKSKKTKRVKPPMSHGYYDIDIEKYH